MEEKYSLGVRSHCYYLFLSGNTNGLRREAMETRIQNNWPGCWTRQPWPGRKTQQPYSSSLASVILQLLIHRNKSFSSSVRFHFFFMGLILKGTHCPAFRPAFHLQSQLWAFQTRSVPGRLSSESPRWGGITLPRLWSTMDIFDGCPTLQQEEMSAWCSYGCSHSQKS